MVPTVELPPVIPFTFQLTAVFVVFCTVAVNWRVLLTRTVAEAGEIAIVTTGATTFTKTLLDVSPSDVFTTTGTDDFAAGAFPLAVTRVDDTTVVGSGAPSNHTTGPDVNPAPSTVRVKLPVGTGDGLTAAIVGIALIVTVAVPLEPGELVLVARTVTVAGFGIVAGAV